MPLVSLIQKIGILFLFSLEDGRVKFLGPRLGKNLAAVLAREVEKKSEGKFIKVAISHADDPAAANELKNILEKNPKSEVLFISSVTPVIGVHAGPGALLVGFYTVGS